MSDAKNFIQQVAPGAVEMQQKYGLPAAAVISQACLETGYGRYVTKDMDTGKTSNNLFNIKGTGPAGSVKVYTKEMKNGRWVTVLALFKAYRNFAESFADYASFIMHSNRYKNARAQKDPRRYLEDLHKAGYATDPKYVEKTMSIIERYDLIKVVNDLMPQAPKTHTVAKGETLSSIARKYGVTLKKLIEANKDKIEDPNKIFPGMVLVIP